MLEPMITISQLRNFLNPVFKKTDVTKAFLFGSYARGTADKGSDIDILIIKKTDKRFLDRFEEFSEIYSLLKGYAVDLLVYSPEELDRNRDRPFVKTILSEGISLYEQ